MFRLLDVQVNTRPVKIFPFASRAEAVKVSVPPTISDPVDGATVMVATGGTPTVMVAVAVLPSLVAVTVAMPVAVPVTRPLEDTLALVGSELLHVMTRPVSAMLLASRGVAVSCCVPPTATVAAVGAIVRVATGTCVTVRDC